MQKVTVCKTEYPNRITMGAMIDFKRDTGKDVKDIGEDVELLVRFMYCCVRSACRTDKVDFALTFEEFADGIDLAEFNTFQQGMTDGNDSDEAKKKKAPKM